MFNNWVGRRQQPCQCSDTRKSKQWMNRWKEMSFRAAVSFTSDTFRCELLPLQLNHWTFLSLFISPLFLFKDPPSTDGFSLHHSTKGSPVGCYICWMLHSRSDCDFRRKQQKCPVDFQAEGKRKGIQRRRRRWPNRRLFFCFVLFFYYFSV